MYSLICWKSFLLSNVFLNKNINRANWAEEIGRKALMAGIVYLIKQEDINDRSGSIELEVVDGDESDAFSQYGNASLTSADETEAETPYIHEIDAIGGNEATRVFDLEDEFSRNMNEAEPLATANNLETARQMAEVIQQSIDDENPQYAQLDVLHSRPIEKLESELGTAIQTEFDAFFVAQMENKGFVRMSILYVYYAKFLRNFI